MKNMKLVNFLKSRIQNYNKKLEGKINLCSFQKSGRKLSLRLISLIVTKVLILRISEEGAIIYLLL